MFSSPISLYFVLSKRKSKGYFPDAEADTFDTNHMTRVDFA